MDRLQIIIEIQNTILIYNINQLPQSSFNLVGEQQASYSTLGYSATCLDHRGLLQGRQ